MFQQNNKSENVFEMKQTDIPLYQHFTSSFFANLRLARNTITNFRYRKATQNTFVQKCCSLNVDVIDTKIFDGH